MNIPHFEDKRDLFKFLKENKQALIAEKKYMVKHADTVYYSTSIEDGKGNAFKSENMSLSNVNKIQIKAVINTTNLLDSHGDVHIKGLWNKSVKEQKNIYLLQEHKMTFTGIISDNVKASTKTYKWSELGFDYQGDTQALVFDVEAEKDRNPYMFEQYAKNRVKNHSVGMRYVKIDLAVNSEEKYWAEEKEIWDKYINEVANKTDAEEQGFFWAVTEAKFVEGSAVPVGSNFATPTISTTEAAKSTFETIEPSQDTQTEAEKLLSLIKF